MSASEYCLCKTKANLPCKKPAVHGEKFCSTHKKCVHETEHKREYVTKTKPKPATKLTTKVKTTTKPLTERETAEIVATGQNMALLSFWTTLYKDPNSFENRCNRLSYERLKRFIKDVDEDKIQGKSKLRSKKAICDTPQPKSKAKAKPKPKHKAIAKSGKMW